MTRKGRPNLAAATQRAKADRSSSPSSSRSNKKPPPRTPASPEAVQPINTTTERLKNFQVALPTSLHGELRSLSHECETTMKAVALALFEVASRRDPDLMSELRELTSGGRLEQKRGPKPRSSSAI